MHVLAVMQAHDVVVRQVVLVIHLVTDMHYVVLVDVALETTAAVRIVIVVVATIPAHIRALVRIDPVPIAIVNVSAAVSTILAVLVLATRAVLKLEAVLALLSYTQQLDTITMYDLDIFETAVKVRGKRSITTTIYVAHDATLPITSVLIPLVTQPRIETVVSLRVPAV